MVTGPVLLTGAAGLLGQWLLRTAPGGIEVVAGIRHRQAVDGVPSVVADLCDREVTRCVLGEVRPRFVIHTAYAKDEGSIVDATRHVVEAAAEVGAVVLLTSSDTVLPGDGIARDESAPADATLDYGRWKRRAEQIVREASPDNVVVRLPLLVSVDPDDHVVAQLREGAERGVPSRWFVDEMRLPAMASDVAAAIWSILALPVEVRAGCWHLPGPEHLSRWEIACRMVGLLGLPVEAIEPEQRPSDTDRPQDLNFTGARAAREIGWSPTPIT